MSSMLCGISQQMHMLQTEQHCQEGNKSSTLRVQRLLTMVVLHKVLDIPQHLQRQKKLGRADSTSLAPQNWLVDLAPPCRGVGSDGSHSCSSAVQMALQPLTTDMVT